MNWWEMPEAYCYFGYFRARNEEERQESVKDIMMRRIKLFRAGFLTSSGWRNVVEDGDIHNKANEFFIYQIKRRCRYLFHALSIALINKDNPTTKGITWKECCAEAVKKNRESESYDFGGIIDCNEKEDETTNHWVCDQAVMKWFRIFCHRDKAFLNIPYRRSLMNKDPPIFEQNPDLKDDFLMHAKDNLQHLTTGVMLEYVHNVLIPKLVEQERKETESDNLTKEEVLKQYRLTSVCLNTVKPTTGCMTLVLNIV